MITMVVALDIMLKFHEVVHCLISHSLPGHQHKGLDEEGKHSALQN
jgi:hypothetical protein